MRAFAYFPFLLLWRKNRQRKKQVSHTRISLQKGTHLSKELVSSEDTRIGNASEIGNPERALRRRAQQMRPHDLPRKQAIVRPT